MVVWCNGVIKLVCWKGKVRETSILQISCKLKKKISKYNTPISCKLKKKSKYNTQNVKPNQPKNSAARNKVREL